MSGKRHQLYIMWHEHVRGCKKEANNICLPSAITTGPHNRDMRRCSSHWDAGVKVHVVVVEHNQSIRSTPSAHCGPMANIVCGESNNVEVVNVANRWSAVGVMEEQIAHNGAAMRLNIQVTVHCNTCPSRGLGLLNEQISPRVSAICQNAKALPQGVY